MRFRLTFKDVGRNNHNAEFVKDFNSRAVAEKFAYKYADDFLLSQNTSLEPTKDKDIYFLWAGIRNVGTIKIEEIEQK